MTPDFGDFASWLPWALALLALAAILLALRWTVRAWRMRRAQSLTRALGLAESTGRLGTWAWNPARQQLHASPGLRSLYGIRPDAGMRDIGDLAFGLEEQ